MLIEIDGNGNLVDPAAIAKLDALLESHPQTLILGAHGWYTTEDNAKVDYSDFIEGLLPLDGSAASIGIHWPSALGTSLLDDVIEPMTFWADRKMADVVGSNGFADLIRNVWSAATPPGRLVLIGHSFGCAIIASAIKRLLAAENPLAWGPTYVIMLQPAIVAAALNTPLVGHAVTPAGAGQYGSAALVDPGNPFRWLITKSYRDKACGILFPLATGQGQAMGAVGPDPEFFNALDGTVDMIDVGWTPTPASQDLSKFELVVADLTNLHDHDGEKNAGPAGSHSDIFQPEIFRLIEAFVGK